MKKPEKLQFILSASKILSVNSLYNAKIVTKGRKQFATIYKSGESKKTEAYIKDQVRALDIPNNYPWINKKTRFDMVITVIFKSGLLLRDLDNTIKLIQDGIFRALDINDSHVMSIKAYKTLCPGIQDEKICIQLSETIEEPRFDKLTEDPPRVTSMYIYGNPGDDFLGELKNIDVMDSKDNADCECYLLTPDNITPDLIAEITSTAYEVALGNYGCLLVGYLGDDERGFLKTLSDLGGKRIIAKNIKSQKELLDYIEKPRRRKKNESKINN